MCRWGLKIKDLSGKKLSHRRSNFPSALSLLCGGIEQRMLELQPEQMITLAVGDAYNLCSDVLCTLRDRCRCGQRGAWDFERNLRCWPKGAVDGYKGTSSGYVQCRCELQKVFAALITASDEYRNGKR